MAARKRTTTRKAPEVQGSTEECKLKAFFDGAGKFPGFAFARFYFEGEGQRSGIAGKVRKKLFPGSEPVAGGTPTAARWDLLLPTRAAQDYMDLDHCLAMYDRAHPATEVNAYTQVTFYFPDPPNLHDPWERARGFARTIVNDRGLPMLAVLHAPHLAGSPNPPHVHLIILPRRLTQLGWGEFDREVPNDRGQRELHAAWLEFQRTFETARHLPSAETAA